MKADALVQEAAVKLKLGFSCQVIDDQNSFENNLMLNIWARKNVVDWWHLQPALVIHYWKHQVIAAGFKKLVYPCFCVREEKLWDSICNVNAICYVMYDTHKEKYLLNMITLNGYRQDLFKIVKSVLAEQWQSSDIHHEGAEMGKQAAWKWLWNGLS